MAGLQRFCGHGLRGRRQRKRRRKRLDPLTTLALSPRKRRVETSHAAPLTYVGLRQLVRDHVEGGPLQLAHAGEPSELAAEEERLVHPFGGVAGGAGGVALVACLLGLVVQGVQPRKL